MRHKGATFLHFSCYIAGHGRFLLAAGAQELLKTEIRQVFLEPLARTEPSVDTEPAADAKPSADTKTADDTESAADTEPWVGTEPSVNTFSSSELL